MKVLIYDNYDEGLPFAVRCQEVGHKVKLWIPPEKGKVSSTGKGIVERITNWRMELGKSDIIVMTGNAFNVRDIEPFFKKGYPIFGPNMKAAKLEIDREYGQEIFDVCGVETIPYKVFSNFDEAIKYVEKEKRPFVAKPCGEQTDKNLSYVPKTEEDLICMLTYWKNLKLKGKFMLQEMVKGIEMAVGGWFGPGGFSKWINENWEEKRLMPGGYGPNTGEMGTVMRYTEESKLFDSVLKPVTSVLQDLNYVGYVDVNCIIKDDGTPCPLEFTTRFGWPHFNFCQYLHKGDPVGWMLDIIQGKDTLKCNDEIAVGVVMATGKYSWPDTVREESYEWPVRGITPKNIDNLFLSKVMIGEAPVKIGGKIKWQDVMVSSDQHIVDVVATGETVTDAQKAVYKICNEIYWPPHKIMRTDIGNRLEDALPALQNMGYAMGVDFK